MVTPARHPLPTPNLNRKNLFNCSFKKKEKEKKEQIFFICTGGVGVVRGNWPSVKQMNPQGKLAQMDV